MVTQVYYREAEDGGVIKYAVFHRNQSNARWEHPYEDKATCGACLGTSTAPPPERSRA